ncbi:hypothetical protein EDD18DRAFT_1407413 [Armillaria luteobubalina]|uniref:DUF6535 domain-containing protein n=1 Tax=Armillaria luteobubalina TaxID=153913 RepID=A0AA39PZN1_9AGAR|nr:hypothetical protein EDD18DRAFT_1407413 [Armillaria luteobubalina]
MLKYRHPFSSKWPSFMFTLNPYTKFTPAATDVWLNDLSFMSLSLSLATALADMLVNQWLPRYIALPSGSPRERSHVRQYRYGGFQKRHVLVVVGTPSRSNPHHAWDLLRRIDLYEIVIESIDGLPLSARAAVKKIFGEVTRIRDAHKTLLGSSTQYLEGGSLKPCPGMESKFERLLRFELFIPHMYSDYINEIPLRDYVDAADDEGLT